METKYKLQLGVISDINDISQSVVSALSSEYLIDTIRDIIRTYNKETNLTKFMDKFADLINKSYDVSFVSVNAWLNNKTDTNLEMLGLVQELDKYLAEKQITKETQVLAEVQQKMQNFLVSLSAIKITPETIEFSNLDIEKEYIASMLEQLRLLDEGMLLSSIADMSLEFTPLDVEKNRNVFIEEKLNNLNKVTNSCQKIFDDDYDRLLSQVVSMYNKFYDICYATLTDGEKAEKARKVVKSINPHRLVLDKLENKLTKANELKRQLIIHEKRLKEGLEVQNDGFAKRMEENPDEKDIFENEMNGVKFVTENYFGQIENSIAKVNKLEENITKHYKVLDQLENALKTAIPTEDDMKKYSSLAFKFQELLVRLELAKSQVNKSDKELNKLINTVVMGLGTLVRYAVEIKDLYLRNAMLGATFRAVNALNDFATNVNKSVELSKIKFVTDKLAKYSTQEQAFTGDLLTYRRVCNNAIRDISIIMGKAITDKGLMDIADLLDITIKQLEHLEESLVTNNNQQVETMRSIMEI